MLKALALMKPHWRLFAVSLAASLALSVLWLLPPVMAATAIDSAIPQGDKPLLVRLILGMAGVAALIAVLSPLQSHCLALAGDKILQDVRLRLFQAIRNQSYRFFIANDAGVIANRFWNDPGEIGYALRTSLIDSISNILLMAAAAAFMLFWNWQLALALLGLIPLAFGIGVFAGRLQEKATERLVRRNEEMASFAFDRLDIGGYTLLNGVGYAKDEDERAFRSLSQAVVWARARQNLAGEATRTTMTVLPILASIIIYAYGGFGAMRGDLTLGALVAFVALSVRLAAPVGELANLYVNGAEMIVALRRIFEWLDLKPEVADAPDAVDLTGVKGRVSLKNVSLAHEGTPIIRNLSLEFPPGATVALAGRSGAGKTTLAHLILRFYDPDSGAVELDCQDIRRAAISSLRESMCLVPQESVVYSASIRDNLLIAKPSASESELRGACAQAQLLDMIERLPAGFDSEVGEMGYRLSGGERQRLSIARAILKRPKVVIMDEPASALDSITESAIRNALANVFRDSTTIIIAHRLSTILSADAIAVIDGGELVDYGAHAELLSRCSLYRRLCEEQYAGAAS